jgi:hypothetical protein
MAGKASKRSTAVAKKAAAKRAAKAAKPRKTVERIGELIPVAAGVATPVLVRGEVECSVLD